MEIDNETLHPNLKILGEALRALKGDNPLIKDAQRQLWKKIWGFNSINDWATRLKDEPEFFTKLHVAIPEDADSLKELLLAASFGTKRRETSYIVGLLNDRLEKCRAETIPSATVDRLTHYLDASRFSNRQNYNGFVCAQILTEEGAPLNKDIAGSHSKLEGATNYKLALWLDPNRQDGVWGDQVLIETGKESDFVTFGFEVDCATLYLPYGLKRVRLHRKSRSEAVSFEFKTPKGCGSHSIIVHLFQSEHLIMTFMVSAEVIKKG